MNKIAISDNTGKVLYSIESFTAVSTSVASNISSAAFSYEKFIQQLNIGNDTVNKTITACTAAIKNSSAIFSTEGFVDKISASGKKIGEMLVKAFTAVKNFFINIKTYLTNFIRSKTQIIMYNTIMREYKNNGNALQDGWKLKLFENKGTFQQEDDICNILHSYNFDTYSMAGEEILKITPDAVKNGTLQSFCDKEAVVFNDINNKIDSGMNDLDNKESEFKECKTLGDYFGNAENPEEWFKTLNSPSTAKQLGVVKSSVDIWISTMSLFIYEINKLGVLPELADYSKSMLTLSRNISKITSACVKSNLLLGMHVVHAGMLAVKPSTKQ